MRSNLSSFVKKWDHLDRQLCHLVLGKEDDTKISPEDIRESLLHRWRLIKAFEAALAHLPSDCRQKTVKCLIIGTPLDRALFDDSENYFVKPLASLLSQSYHKRLSLLDTDNLSDAVKSYSRILNISTSPIIHLRQHYHLPLMVEQTKLEIGCADVVVFMFTLHPDDWRGARDDLNEIGELLRAGQSQNQSPLIVGLCEGKWAVRSHFNCLKSIVQRLGGVDGETLSKLPTDWSLACLHYEDDVVDKFMALSEWIAFEVATRSRAFRRCMQKDH